MVMQPTEYEYLGDGLYVRYDGYHLVLMAGTPADPGDTVYLDSNVYDSLLRYVSRLTQKPQPGGEHAA